jgi:hypothetical protein
MRPIQFLIFIRKELLMNQSPYFKSKALGLFIALGIIVGANTACDTDTESLECIAANHCLSEDGESSCDPGYEWLNPDENIDYRCTEILPSPVPQFGTRTLREFEKVATFLEGLSTPRDLDFNPHVEGQLWVVNRADDSTLIINDATSDEPVFEYRRDSNAAHFMEEVSSIAFASDFNNFGTCHESRNALNDTMNPDDFMGPALWSADLDIYAAVNQNSWVLLGSHLDMLHQSPLCMGIEHEVENVYWVTDGNTGDIVRYDFATDHGPGYDDHSDGIVRRYNEFTYTRVPDVPSHLALDKKTNWLYIADTGGSRIMRLDITSGLKYETLIPENEPLQEYSTYKNTTFEVFAEDLDQPSGIVLTDDHVIVSLFGTSELVAFDYEGKEVDRIETRAKELSGITIDPDGDLWFVDQAEDKLFHLVP